MKFKYDLSRNYYQIFNESQGIVMFRKEIEKNIYNIGTYTDKCKKFVFMLICFLLVALFFNWLIPYTVFTKVMWFLFALMASIVTLLILMFIVSYNDQKKLLHKGEMQFSKAGILDISDSGIRLGVTWDLVDFAVITDSVIVILTKTNFYFHFGQDLIDDVLIAINKFNPDLKVLDASISRYREKIQKELEEKNKIEAEKLAKEAKKDNKKKEKEESAIDVKEIEQDIIKEIESPKYEDYKDEESIKE